MLSLPLNKVSACVSLGLAFAATMVSSGAIASEQVSEKLKVSGFIGLGYASTDANNFLGTDKSGLGIGSSEIIDAGIKLSYQINNNLTFNGQAAYRKLGESISDDNIRLDYASFTYVSNALDLGEQSFSLGRVKVSGGLYNEYRDVPVSKPSILLSQAVYLDVFRSLFLSIDGLSIHSYNDVFGGNLTTQLAYGEANIEGNFAENGIGPFLSGQILAGNTLTFSSKYRYKDWLFGVSLSSTETGYSASEQDFFPSLGPTIPPIPIVDGEFEVNSRIISAQYNLSSLELSAEYVYRDFDIKGLVPDFIPIERERPMEGYYLQAKYPISQSISGFVRYERFYRNANDKDGSKNQNPMVPSWAERSSTQSIGIHWQISRNWHFFAEYHQVKGSAFLPPFSVPTPSALESEDWNIIATELVYRF